MSITERERKRERRGWWGNYRRRREEGEEDRVRDRVERVGYSWKDDVGECGTGNGKRGKKWLHGYSAYCM